MILRYPITAESEVERILKIGQHLTVLGKSQRGCFCKFLSPCPIMFHAAPPRMSGPRTVG